MRQTTTFVILSVAAVLVACASQVPSPATVAGGRQGIAPAPALAARQEQQPVYLNGYRRMIVDGQERFCTLGDVVGSRIKQEVCLTRAQLEASEADAQQLLQKIRQGNSECPASPVMMGGDPLGGLNCIN